MVNPESILNGAGPALRPEWRRVLLALLAAASAALSAGDPGYFTLENLDPVPHRLTVRELRRENGSSALTHEASNPQRVFTRQVEVPARGAFLKGPGALPPLFSLPERRSRHPLQSWTSC